MAPRSQANHSEAVGVLGDDIEGLGSDGTGRTEDYDVAHRVSIPVVCNNPHVTPNNIDELLTWNADLTAAEIQARERAKSLTDHWRASIGPWYDQGNPPVKELAAHLGREGLLGMCIPIPGESRPVSTALGYGVVCAELEGLDSGVRSLASVQGSLAMEAIHRYGDQAQQARWLPGLSRGDLIGSFALTEPNAGSDPASLTTSVAAGPNGLVLNGAKRWITNGTVADVVVVWARFDERISAFAVPTDLAGVDIQPIDNKGSLRASASARAAFTDVALPKEAHLAGARGVGAALVCLNEARFGICFGVVGAARDALSSALEYTQDRIQFGKPLAAFQITQTKLAQMTAEVARSWQLALWLGRLKDRGNLQPAQVSMTKAANVRSALTVSRTAREILGANGILFDHSPIRHAANLESVLTYEGTEDMHHLIVGHTLTGRPAFR